MTFHWLNKLRSLWVDAQEYEALPKRDRFRKWVAGTRDIDREFRVRANGRILLDLGCGPPEARIAAGEIKCSRYVGVDLLVEMRPDVASTLDHLCVRDNSVDNINCISVLEHVYKPRDAIAEMFRVLRPGGCVRVQVPFLLGYHGYPDDYFRYTHSALCRMFEEAGFRVAIVETDWTKGVYLNAAKILEDGSWAFVRPWRRFLTRVLSLMLFRLSASLEKYYAPGEVGMYQSVAMLAEKPVDGAKRNEPFLSEPRSRSPM
jgi:predicted SAM-dependent methyltransferase